MNLETMPKKLATLLALATAQRLQTLASIRLPNIKFQGESVKIYIPARLKTFKVGREQPMLHLPFLWEQPTLNLSASKFTNHQSLDKTNAKRTWC